MSNSENLMFVKSIDKYKIYDRTVELISESHQEFVKKIDGCKKKGYKLIDDYIREKPNPVVILELSDKFENKYTHTYSTNLNIIQKMEIDKIYADIRYNIFKDYQYMYDFNEKQLKCKMVSSMIKINLDKVRTFHAKACYKKGTKDKEFIEQIMHDVEENLNLLHQFDEKLQSHNRLIELNKYNDNEFMKTTNEYNGTTISQRILEIIKHSWKKITDICIMIIILSYCIDNETIIILLGSEHVKNLNHILKVYCQKCKLD